MTSEEKAPDLRGFTFIRLLGRGGMASVWEAKQHDPARIVAVKILNDDISEFPEDVENFYSEAKIAGQLDHENIVTVFEVGCQRGIFYYVMELAAGYDTLKWLTRKGKLELDDVMTIAESVAVALDYAAKSIGIIHCDIKPANIMVDGDGTVRLTDLGIARFERGQLGTTADVVTGTPSYMSPEQARGKQDLDVRADMYSLGATMYNLLCGKRLFQGMSDNEILDAQCSLQVPDIRDITPEIPFPHAALIAKLLAKKREKRPRNWRAALVDIARVRKNLMPLGDIVCGKNSTMFLRLSTSSVKKTIVLKKSQTQLINAEATVTVPPAKSTPAKAHPPSLSHSIVSSPSARRKSTRKSDYAFWVWLIVASIVMYGVALFVTLALVSS